MKEIKILLHNISYWYKDGYEGEMDDADIEHIKKAITDGCDNGELNTSHEEHRGWWQIIWR